MRPRLPADARLGHQVVVVSYMVLAGEVGDGGSRVVTRQLVPAGTEIAGQLVQRQDGFMVTGQLESPATGMTPRSPLTLAAIRAVRAWPPPADRPRQTASSSPAVGSVKTNRAPDAGVRASQMRSPWASTKA
jgi:hypothetical protein